MTVEVKGMAELESNLAKLQVNFGKELKDALIAGGLLVETQAKQNVQEVSSGERVVRYRNGGAKKNHTASKPGDSPNSDTSKLITGIALEVRKDSVFVGSSAKYTEALEFGTANMEARPFLHKALIAKQSKINGLFVKAVKDAISASSN
jgi:HK97 gp10 family phage protein